MGVHSPQSSPSPDGLPPRKTAVPHGVIELPVLSDHSNAGNGGGALHGEHQSLPARPYEAAVEPVESEKRVRGPRNRRPRMLRFTAIVHIMSRLTLLLAVLLIPAAAILEPVVLKPLLVLPIISFVTWLFWLLAKQNVGCRVCGMRMFANKPCVKSNKAPSWPVIGPHTTLAILSLVSSTVRCPYCGTPNELADRRNGN